MSNRIIVVDDQPENLKAIKRTFFDDSYEMLFCQSGEEALQVVTATRPDLVLLDIMMPGMDGYEVCHRIKSAPETSNVMVLFLSGKATLEDRLHGYKLEADDYITKPYQPEELRAKVHILLRLKRAQDELKKVNKHLEELVSQRTRQLVRKERQAMIGQMIQGIVHNLKGPLMAVTGSVHSAQYDVKTLNGLSGLSDEQQRALSSLNSYLEIADSAQEILKELIDSLLIKGSKDSERHKSALDLNTIIADEIRFLGADLFFKHQVRKNLDLAPNLPVIHGVHSDFSQVFSNLMKNAADAMRSTANKELSIRTLCDNDSVVTEFKDSGSGIAPNHLDKIFDPFFTTKPSRDDAGKDEPAGTGLGLYMCSELLGYYNGTIQVESTPGEGARFIIRIPSFPAG